MEDKMDQTYNKPIKNKLKTVQSKLKLRENRCLLFVRVIVLRLGHSLGRSAPWRLGLGGAPPRLALLCALVWCDGGCGSAGRGGDGRGRGGGADPVGGADGAVLDGLVLWAARDGHLLAALVFVRDCTDDTENHHLGSEHIVVMFGFFHTLPVYAVLINSIYLIYSRKAWESFVMQA